jgi:ribonuclease P protein component
MCPAKKPGRLGGARRLKGAKAFAKVRAARCSASNLLLVVYAAANGLPYSRLGLMVGRQHGGAVRRNRLKRLLRAAFSFGDEHLPGGYDLICIPKPVAEPSLADYRRAVRNVTERAIARCRNAGPPACS